MHNKIYNYLSSLALCMLLFAGCGPSQATLQSLESEIAQERSQIRGLKSAQKSIDSYHSHLKAGKGQSLLLSKTALEAAIKSMLPYTFKGKELDKKYLKGQISFTKVEKFELLPGNRARFWLHFDGSKIKTQKVPSFAKGQVKSLKKAVKAGRMLIEVVGSVNQEKGTFKVRSTPISAQFRQENTSSNQSRFLDAARRKIFRKSKKIPLPAGLGRRVTALTTPHHLVFIKK